jgi:hypothetical protein
MSEFCEQCWGKIPDEFEDTFSLMVKSTPWSEPEKKVFCSEECYDYCINESVFYCELCPDGEDYIYIISPNGRMRYNSYSEEHEGYICLKCRQEMYFKQGMDIENSSPDSMDAMFYSFEELAEHGFKKAFDKFVRGSQSYKELYEKMVELNEDNLVILNIDAHGMIEAHTSVYIKPRGEVNG